VRQLLQLDERLAESLHRRQDPRYFSSVVSVVPVTGGGGLKPMP
jgi:hypothetical protein